MMASIIVALALVLPARCAPSIAFPLNAQVPPVARASEAFRFTFARTSFSSTSAVVNYSLSDAPQWLHVDGDSRSLFGTPSTQDVGPARFLLTATDDAGSTDMNVTLIVSPDPAPTLAKPVSDQLAAWADFSGPSSLSFYPSSPFRIAFAPDTFAFGHASRFFYAVSSDHTPLPSWVNFDSQTLIFSGTTPHLASLIEPPQTFGIKLIGSDVAGFSGASADFNLVVGSHRLSFTQSVVLVDVQRKAPLRYLGLKDSLSLDTRPIKAEEITSVEADPPAWLSLDKHSFGLTGDPPEDVSSVNFTIVVRDIYKDEANLTVALQVHLTLFTRSLQDVNATIGRDFKYQIPSAVLAGWDVEGTSEIAAAEPWLTFDPNALEWTGRVPDTTQPGPIHVRLTLTSRATKVSESQSFKLNLLNDDTVLAPGSSTGPYASPTAGGAAPTGSHRSRQGRIVLAVVPPIVSIVVVVVVVVVAIVGCRRLRRRRSRRDSSRSIRMKISRPLEPEDPPAAADRVATGPVPRLPRPKRFSHVWKSYPDLSTEQNDGPDAKVVNDIEPKALARERYDRQPSRAGLDMVNDAASPSRRNQTPKRPPRPSDAIMGLTRQHVEMPQRPRPVTTFTDDPSESDWTTGESGSNIVRHSAYNASAPKSASRNTWATVDSNDLGSFTASMNLVRTTSGPSEAPYPNAVDFGLRSVRLVPNSTANCLSASLAQRYGYSMDGGSPYFGGSCRGPSRRQTWRTTRAASTVATDTPNDDAVDRMSRSLTDGEWGSSDMPSPFPGGETSSRVRWVEVGGPARAYGSRLSENLNRLSRPLSSASFRFSSRTPSMPSRGSIYSGDYLQLPETNRHRHWYRRGRGSKVPSDLGYYDNDDDDEAENALPEETGHEAREHDNRNDHQVEYGVASMAHRPSTASIPGWLPATVPSPLTPRLVEFKRKRAARAGLDQHLAAKVDSSRSASIGSIIRSDDDVGGEPPSSSQKAFI